jgi:hypothetical protein
VSEAAAAHGGEYVLGVPRHGEVAIVEIEIGLVGDGRGQTHSNYHQQNDKKIRFVRRSSGNHDKSLCYCGFLTNIKQKPRQPFDLTYKIAGNTVLTT